MDLQVYSRIPLRQARRDVGAVFVVSELCLSIYL